MAILSVKTIYFTATKRWINIALCLLLVLLSVANASIKNKAINMLFQSNLAVSDTICNQLRSIGFKFDCFASVTLARPLTLKRSLNPALEANPPIAPANALLNQPIYEVNCFDVPLHFTLSNYVDIRTANKSLRQLRTVAVIKSRIAFIHCAPGNSDCHQINMQILSRVINMIDANIVSIYLDRTEYRNLIDLDLCRAEAQNTVDYAVYTSEFTPHFSALANDRFPDVIYRGIVFRRPITSIFMAGNRIQNTSFLSQLPLQEDYSFSFLALPKVVEIDFAVLQMLSVKCSQITIMSSPGTKLTITGLDNAIDKHPSLTLRIPWNALQYLGTYNQSAIRVYNIIDLDPITTSSASEFQSAEEPKSSEFRIFATQITVEIATNMPCCFGEYYKQIYTLQAYAKYGLEANEVLVCYGEGRTDLEDTLEALSNINDFMKVPIDIKDESVVCCGDALSEPSWKLKQNIEIQLDHCRIHNWLRRCKEEKIHFCQNIHYPAIEIIGAEVPYKQQVKACIDILILFHNISAKTLRISNVRSNNQTTSRFSMATLKSNAAKYTKWNLKVETLVLDNVDDQIIYWMLGHYDFTERTEVHILNAGFSNLAITQVLSLPVGRQIATILINDFLGLNEVKYFVQREQIKGFSLFKYVADNPAKDLGLNKLSLLLNDIELGLYSAILREFVGYGLHIPAMPFKNYIKLAPTNPGPADIANKKRLILYNATLEAIKSDFVICQATKDSVQLNSIANLLVRFSDRQTLTEACVATIIRWAACRFTNLSTLRLINTEMPESEQNNITARDYLIRKLDLLNSITIESIDPNTPPIELLSRPLRISSVSNASNTTPISILMSSALASQLACHPDQLDSLTSSSHSTVISYQKVIEDLKQSKQDNNFVCPACRDVLNLPEAAKEPKLVPKETFATIYYLTCGHKLCNGCVKQVDRNKGCVTCRRADAYEAMHQLISAPLSNFVFVKDSVNTSAEE
ncbi:hypothetical protein NEHOM01_2403, partial [Nematocida homosporus]|uniref:uncharacterized protein n=1 Tax=Nematocida homosporus TaxID=1912981 RepID=UPI00221F8E87